jgi:putative DNA primase/helicase
MGFFIPETMKQFNNWVVWRKEGEGHHKKIPYDPRTGRRANPTKPCCSYEEAIACLKYGNEYDGIGFVFTKESGLTFIDLDKCIDEEGNESALAKDMQDLFKDSYIELSQSEKGLHIVCIGTVPKAIKTKEIEIYSNVRYMAMTGNSTNAKEPQRAQEKLNMIFDMFKTEKAEKEPKNEPQGYAYKCDVDAHNLIEVISNSKQGEKWQKLHNGIIEGYPSRSEAMLAYIAITNYFASGRIELIKEVFAQSQFPVADKKYKKTYYINMAIQKAQETATGSANKKRTTTKIIEMYEEPQRGRRRVK